MDKKAKFMMYYFDSKLYSENEIRENLQKECENHFFSKKAKIEITLNEFGTYIATLVFEDKSKSFKRNKKKDNEEMKKSKINKLTTKKYGSYKQTGTFRPI